MVVLLFDYCTVVWDSCDQGSKSYSDKLNHHTACTVVGCVVKADELSTLFGWPYL